jgi:hypothetical protein
MRSACGRPGFVHCGSVHVLDGRPSLPADLVGSVLVLKELYDLFDRQTAEALM